MSLMDMAEDAWDFFVDGISYLFSFEWVGDVFEGMGDFFGAMFEGITEFSFMGVTFGILSVSASYATKFLNVSGTDKQMTLIASMTQYMPLKQKIIWTIASYVGAFIGGYLLGRYFENT